MALQCHQGSFDLGALGIAGVMGLFGEQRVDPFTFGDVFRADRQRGQVAVGGDVVQRFFVQLIGVEEGLQAGQLLGEGHYRATLGNKR
ncbi:hypothetical protein D3C78_1085180 [compost metagenome]